MKKRINFLRDIAGYLLFALLLIGVTAFPVNAKAPIPFTAQKCVIRAASLEKNYSGKSYFLAAHQTGRQKGTKKHPFTSFKKALKKLKPGDTLYIRGGIYRQKVVLDKSLCGKKNAFITIRNYKKETPVFIGNGKKGDVKITMDRTAYVRICGLRFSKIKGADGCGILVRSGHHLVIADNTFEKIGVSNTKKESANAILLFGENKKASIHDVIVQKNQIKNCKTGWGEAIAITANCRRIDVLFNTIKNTGNIGIDYSGNYGYCKEASKDFPKYGLVYGNEVSKCISKNAQSYGIYVDGAQKISILKNNVSNCSGGIEAGAEQVPLKKEYGCSDIIIEENRLKNNGKNAITIGGYELTRGLVRNVTIRKNRCELSKAGGCMVTLNKCENISISKNTWVRKCRGISIVSKPLK